MLLRKILDYHLALTEEGRLLAPFRPLVTALDTFMYEPSVNTKSAPHVRDAVDLKRWMMVVVFALIPCILVACWNTGVQKFVYSSGDSALLTEFYSSCHSLRDYFSFCFKDGRYWQIILLGLGAFLPVMIISYMVGGLCEGIFACVRKHDIAEGFLVTGMLYALILPPTIPYWMVALGVAVGVILSKELFGGTGMNIMNPALSCRAFLFFTFPGQMSGDVWVGTNPVVIKESLLKMNQQALAGPLDGFSQASCLQRFSVGLDIKRIHVDTIGANFTEHAASLKTLPYIEKQFETWQHAFAPDAILYKLQPDQLKNFVTSPIAEGGLGLSVDNFENAYRFAQLQFEQGIFTDWNFFFGNKLGCFGETSVLACIIGAAILIWTRIGSWKTMVAVLLGAFVTAGTFELAAHLLGPDKGAWNPAILAFPAYKHLLLGGLAFGAVFMATDPVSSTSLSLSKWIYGFFIGAIAVFIRGINPAYPEGVMLAILTGNVFAPLIDHYVSLFYLRRYNRARV